MQTGPRLKELLEIRKIDSEQTSTIIVQTKDETNWNWTHKAKADRTQAQALKQ